MISEVKVKPRCIHALGAVEKSNGKLRPITDCSMPGKKAINNYMDTTFRSFSYKSINSVVTKLDSKD